MPTAQLGNLWAKYLSYIYQAIQQQKSSIMPSSDNSLKLFDELAISINSLVVVIDPLNFRIQHISHVLPGYTKEEVIGAEVFNFLSPDHIENYRMALLEAANTSTRKAIDIEIVDNVNPDITTWYNCIISPIKNDLGQIESLLVISKDVTELKRGEIERANNEEKISAIINNTSDIILSIDRKFNVTECNAVYKNIIEQGFGIKEIKGSHILDFIDSKKHTHLLAIYDSVLKGETINDIESFGTLNGSSVYFETGYHPIYNIGKEIIGISIFSRNITERILNDQKLKQSLRDREILFSEIHHRIKNNLALVSSMLQLKELKIENPEAKEILAESRRRIKSTALVHEMLYRNDNFDRLSLHSFVVELFNSIRITPEIELIFEGEDCFVSLEKAFPFGLLMHELIMNSMKHSFSKLKTGRLNISVNKLNAQLAINYCDCSGKFPVEVDFMDTSTTGLMLIHSFIKQLDGSIEMTSKAPPSYLIKFIA